MNNNKPIVILFICLIIVYCILVLVVKKTDVIAISSVATALFTGLAVLWAYSSFKTQRESLKGLSRQLNINAFSESIRLLMNSTMYNQGRDYIYSNNYSKDLDKVRKVLNIPSSESVGLNDFKKILDQNLRGESGILITEEEKGQLRDSYDKIRFFCMRMEYLGVLSEEDAARNLILDYYGYTIRKTYERLESLIEKTRKDLSTAALYKHYSQLYHLIE